MHVARIKLKPYEEVGLHRDANPQIVIALQGGTVTRLEADGTTNDVHFPTGVAVYREIDPPGEFHRGVNNSPNSLDIISVQLKTPQNNK